MARQTYHFYLNDNRIDHVNLIKKLNEEENISSLVRSLLYDHYRLVDQIKEKYQKHERGS